jgi:LuxR family maltose regulon positive regulatory protein
MHLGYPLGVDGSSGQPTGAASGGDQRARLGLSFDLMGSKLRSPSARPGIVSRHALVDRMLASASAPVICVVAPPGYGKTTLLAQWATQKTPRAGWVSVDRRDNDPVVLLSYLTAALDRLEPLDPQLLVALAAPGVLVLATVLPRFLAAVSAMTQPVALVLDNLELVENRACLDAVAELALGLPAGSQVAVAARRRPALPVALLRARGQMMEVGVTELAMDQGEGRALLQAAAVGLSDADTDNLVRRAEGWPVGLYLAALAYQAAGPRANARFAFSGDDRFLADYLHAELLAHLPTERVAFLTRTAVLERLCGPLCDAILDTRGSDRVLAELEDSNLLLVPLDRRREWYRYHHLFRELLLTELQRREPQLLGELHARAARWCEANGLEDVAVEHAQAAGDADRVARLVATLVFQAYNGGRVETIQRWLGWFEERGLVERYPPLAVAGAWLQTLVGRPAAAERWADAAERGMTASAADTAAQMPPDGSTTESYLALLRGLLCRHGVGRMRADAQAALAGLSPSSRWQTPTMVIKGVAELLDGQPDQADATLAHAVEVGTDVGGLAASSVALAERSLLAVQRNDWHQAETLADQALEIVTAGRLDDYIMSPIVHTVAARTALHRGDVPAARTHLARAARLRPLLTHAVPWLAARALLELGRAYLLLDDLAGARVVLRQARDILQLRPDLGVLPTQVEELWSRLDLVRRAFPGVSSLTAAELRLLPLLATHLTFREIGERLYVSQHTVKTQAISVYHKLAVSSRGQAVQRLQEIGLLAG